MPCFNRRQAFQKHSGAPVTWHYLDVASTKEHAIKSFGISIPCHSCIGCRVDYGEMWAFRMHCERQMHSLNCFITLTYDDSHLPDHSTLVKKDFQDFMKRLRKKFSSVRISYYHCGEYGDQYGRPHYHAILFGFDFPDKILSSSKNGHNFYTSDILSKIWGKGHCLIGEATYETMAYTSRYVTKRVTGKASSIHYANGFDPATGEIFYKLPEYSSMSLKPAIGLTWLQRYYTDIYPSDFLTINGRPRRPPAYFDDQMQIINPSLISTVKLNRIDNIDHENNTPERLLVREEIAKSKNKLFSRDIELSTHNLL